MIPTVCDISDSDMLEQCLSYIKIARSNGKKIVGLMCEYTPREIIMAGGGVAVKLSSCGDDEISPADDVLPSCVCSKVSSIFRQHLEKSNPLMEACDLIVAQTTCDGKKKMFDMMAQTRPVHTMDLPQRPESPYSRLLWIEQCRKLKDALEQRFNTIVTQKDLRKAVGRMNRQRQLYRELAMLLIRKTPPLTGRQLLSFNSPVACMPWAMSKLEQAVKIFGESKGIDELAKAKRVVLTGVPTESGTEGLVEVIESCGGLVVAQENCTGLKAAWEDVRTFGEEMIEPIADKYLHLPCSVMSPNDSRIELLRSLSKSFSPDCIIDLSRQGCLTYDMESHHIREFADEINLPYLRIMAAPGPASLADIREHVKIFLKTL